MHCHSLQIVFQVGRSHARTGRERERSRETTFYYTTSKSTTFEQERSERGREREKNTGENKVIVKDGKITNDDEVRAKNEKVKEGEREA